MSSSPSESDVRLRAVTDADLPIFFEQQREPEANRMAAFPARTLDAFVAHWKKIMADGAVIVRTVVRDGEVAGNILLWEQDGQRLVGYWIGKDHWGMGVATRALAAFLGIVEERPIHAHVAKQNIASIRVLEKCGFTIDSEATESLDRPADGVDELVFGLSRP